MKNLMQWLNDANGEMTYEKEWGELGHVGRN